MPRQVTSILALHFPEAFPRRIFVDRGDMGSELTAFGWACITFIACPLAASLMVWAEEQEDSLGQSLSWNQRFLGWNFLIFFAVTLVRWRTYFQGQFQRVGALRALLEINQTLARYNMRFGRPANPAYVPTAG